MLSEELDKTERKVYLKQFHLNPSTIFEPTRCAEKKVCIIKTYNLKKFLGPKNLPFLHLSVRSQG